MGGRKGGGWALLRGQKGGGGAGGFVEGQEKRGVGRDYERVGVLIIVVSQWVAWQVKPT